MNAKRCVAMILAGGRGERLGGLTRYYSKPAIHFGGSRRLIDFTLNNCRNAGIETIGILGQYFTTNLHEYLGAIRNCGSEKDDIYILSSENNENAYKGTADAVYRNIAFIDRFMPDNVLILSSNHIYGMDYRKMIEFHEKAGASVTMAVTPATDKETSQSRLLKVAKNGRVLDVVADSFESKSDLTAMGIYIFKWDVLRKYLLADSEKTQSQHDFGEDILPDILSSEELVFTYRFNGYWRDVGTVDSLWAANMDQIDNPTAFGFENSEWNLTDLYTCDTPIKIYGEAVIHNSIISGGCSIFGTLEHSVLSDSVTVGVGSEIINSAVMPGVCIGNNVKICNAIIGPNARIMDHAVIGTEYGTDFLVDRQVCPQDVSLVAPWLYIAEGMCFQAGSHIYRERLEQYENAGTGWNNPEDAEPPYHCIPSSSLLWV